MSYLSISMAFLESLMQPTNYTLTLSAIRGVLSTIYRHVFYCGGFVKKGFFWTTRGFFFFGVVFLQNNSWLLGIIGGKADSATL